MDAKDQEEEFIRSKDFEADEEDLGGTGGHRRQKKGMSLVEQQNLYTLLKEENFATVILFRDTTTLVTKLQRINHYRYLIFMGNGNGLISYGKGKGLDFEEALANAYKDAKRNMIAIPLDLFMTFPRAIQTHHNGCQLYLWPRESTNAWGSPIIALMLQLAGVNHTSFRIVARNINPYSLVYCFFMAMTQNVTPKDMAELLGQKTYHQNFISVRRNDLIAGHGLKLRN